MALAEYSALQLTDNSYASYNTKPCRLVGLFYFMHAYEAMT